MIQQIFIYKVYLFRKDTVIELDQDEGQKLKIALISLDPKFIDLIDRYGYEIMLNTSSIEHIEMEEKKETKVISGKSIEIEVKRELTESEKETHKKYLALKGQLSTNKLLK